jgi:hypothetical protein
MPKDNHNEYEEFEIAHRCASAHVECFHELLSVATNMAVEAYAELAVGEEPGLTGEDAEEAFDRFQRAMIMLMAVADKATGCGPLGDAFTEYLEANDARPKDYDRIDEAERRFLVEAVFVQTVRRAQGR